MERGGGSHTPGPWENAENIGVCLQSYGCTSAIKEKGKCNMVAGIFGDVFGGKEVALANARLIAAAPDLLAALIRSQELLASAYDKCVTGSLVWQEFPLVNSDNLNAIALATGKEPS